MEAHETLAFAIASGTTPTIYARLPVNQPYAPLLLEERELLAHGLAHWGGPAHATDALARVMGFENVERLYRDGDGIAEQLRAGEALSVADLARALIATEFVFASDYYGAGWDWENVTGISDEVTIKRLREVQRKLIGVARLPE